MHSRTRRLASVLLLGGASLSALTPIAAAYAQTGPADAPASTATATAPSPQAAGSGPSVADHSAGSDIIVTGTRASLNRSLDLKKQTIGIVDSISAEDIGKFPDQN